MSNWPKDYLVVLKSRPNTFLGRMAPANLDWRQHSSKRYALQGAIRAFDTLRKANTGSDWGVFCVPTKMLVRYVGDV